MYFFLDSNMDTTAMKSVDQYVCVCTRASVCECTCVCVCVAYYHEVWAQFRIKPNHSEAEEGPQMLPEISKHT